MWSKRDEARATYSNEAHIAAQQAIYPPLFGVPRSALSFEAIHKPDSERERILDAEMGVDRIVLVTVETFHRPLKFTVQERFRLPEYAKYQDLTVTEWYSNSADGEPAELYRINAGLFVYGYYDAGTGRFLDAIAVDTTALLLALVKGAMPHTKRTNDRRQTFLALRFAALHRAGVVVWHLPTAKAA